MKERHFAFSNPKDDAMTTLVSPYRHGKMPYISDEKFVALYMEYWHAGKTVNDLLAALPYASTVSIYNRRNVLNLRGANLPLFREKRLTDTKGLRKIVYNQGESPVSIEATVQAIRDVRKAKPATVTIAKPLSTNMNVQQINEFCKQLGIDLSEKLGYRIADRGRIEVATADTCKFLRDLLIDQEIQAFEDAKD